MDRSTLLRSHERVFDALLARWQSPTLRRGIAWGLVAAFLFSICSIELARLGWIDGLAGFPLPTNHLAAISWVFTLLLIVEVLDLVFGLAQSVANALGKQLEIFSLILLRKAFDELPKLPEPISLVGHEEEVLRMVALAASALVVFALLVPYYRLQLHRPISEDERDVRRFVSLKKAVCLGLLGAFVLTGVFFGAGTLTVETAEASLSLDFFEVFYTVLVFADVVLVLGSLTVTREFRFVFRNFAFAVVTVFLRLALATEPLQKAALGVGTALFALGTAWLFEISHRPLPAELHGEADRNPEERNAKAD